jgi:ion channel-forming bestrophin family protein
MARRVEPNPLESTPFWADAMAWTDAVTAKLLLRIAGFGFFATLVAIAHGFTGWEGIDPIYLGYTGGLLAVLLVLRTNASYDRWWEGRKIWGGIVNQSRNLAIKGVEYGPEDLTWRRAFVRACAVFCHAARQSLRSQRDHAVFERLLGDDLEAAKIVSARHMPSAVASRLAKLIAQARTQGMDGFSFLELDRERALLIDYIGACERILKSPIPRVHSIKLRRFILLYLLGLPLALAHYSPWIAPVATMLVAYPLLAIDQIAYELENPFDPTRMSHLPLDTICETIEGDVLALVPAAPG